MQRNYLSGVASNILSHWIGCGLSTFRADRVGWIALVVGAVGLSLAAGPLRAAGADNSQGLNVRRFGATGVGRFVTPAPGAAFPALPGKPNPAPMDFLLAYGHLLGVTHADRQLVAQAVVTDAIGHTHTTFQQVHDGIDVFAGLVRVHVDQTGRLIAINGTFIPDVAVKTTPNFTAQQAEAVARQHVSAQIGAAAGLQAVSRGLMVFRTNLARGVKGTNHLVYEVLVTQGAAVREFVYVDAHRGYVVDQITGIHESIDRRIYSGGLDDAFLVWMEGDGLPFGDVDIDNLIDFAEDTYNVVSSATNGAFLSWDGADGTMHSVNDDPFTNCPNANWNGTSTNFCIGVTGDDTVAHEWGHAFTDSTHNLIYQWQSGALNEAYSDIYGEVIDLLNGSGTDTPGAVRTDGACSAFGGSAPPVCEVHAPGGIAGLYAVGGANFNPPPPMTATAAVELVDDGDDGAGSGSVTDGCQPLVGFTSGSIALVDRGTCAFTQKVLNAQAAGAVAVIVVNNQGDGVFNMGGFAPGILIHAVMLGQSDGQTLRNALPGVNATVSIVASDDPSLRWLQGEDDPAFGGAIRDMWNPLCYGDPGKVSDTAQYTCSTFDNGGVHTNSGIPNHGFALLVDGGVYNGYSMTGIGLTKAFHIYWRAQSVYQVPASGFADHADALIQSCQDLIGVNLYALSADMPIAGLSGEIISPADCAAVGQVVAAVELRVEPTHCAFAPLLDPATPPLCYGAGKVRRVFAEDWESGMDGWMVGTRDVANPATFDTPDWAVVGALPDDRGGSAAFAADLVLGNCGSDLEAGVLYLQSPAFTLTAGAVPTRLAFDHWVATELTWDGGNVKVSVNGSPWQLAGPNQFDFNAYNGTLVPPPQSDDPLGGEPAFTGTDGGSVGGSWGQSQLNFSGIAGSGDEVRLRFELGLDGCNGVIGWFVDDLQVYSCCALDGDVACDGFIGLDDYAVLADCLSGPGAAPAPPSPTSATFCLDVFDSDGDGDVDLADVEAFQAAFTGP
ncbi:MAG: M4 family metallopeptidase [Phycisphaerae bacterium]